MGTIIPAPAAVRKCWVIAQAAWERACRNAGRKRVNTHISLNKYLAVNPWNEFSWISNTEKAKRQFSDAELISILHYFEEEWKNVPVAKLMAKVFLWSAERRDAVASLSWQGLREHEDEFHCETVGKQRVRRWIRIPSRLFEELSAIRCAENDYVFAAYSEQLRNHYLNSSRPWLAERISVEFSPENLGNWFYHRIKDWAEATGATNACVHDFRRTTLQKSREGEDINKQVADDARVSTNVMLKHYVTESDPVLWQSSNRTFKRIRLSLTDAVAIAYGDDRTPPDPLIEKVRRAQDAQDWALVAKLAAELERRSSHQ